MIQQRSTNQHNNKLTACLLHYLLVTWSFYLIIFLKFKFLILNYYILVCFWHKARVRFHISSIHSLRIQNCLEASEAVGKTPNTISTADSCLLHFGTQPLSQTQLDSEDAFHATLFLGMIFSKKSSKQEGDNESQDARSSAFPPDHDQPFDRHSFGRMDFPVSPVHDQESVGVEAWETSSRRPDYFAASSLNTASFELDHTIHNDRDEFTLREQYFASNQPPPPLQGASYEMDDFREPSKPRQISRAPLRGEITPYLGLRARLTQVPINRWTVLLFLVLARMILLFEGLNTDFTSAQQEATTACSKVEDIGSTLASMPHYLSQGGKF